MKMKTIIAAALSLVMLGTAGCSTPAFLSSKEKGTCGENCTWELDKKSGTLTISGAGAMEENGVAWGEWKDKITRVEIEDGVTTISFYAFGGCKNLTDITIPDSVTSIGRNAFSDCSALTDIAIPDSVNQIGCLAFWGCSGLKDIIIPDGVTVIENHTFYECTGLTGITIPDGVTSIGEAAFWGCDNLKSITLPDSVTRIDEDAFAECSNLTIHGSSGSYAEQYAADAGIPFVSSGA